MAFGEKVLWHLDPGCDESQPGLGDVGGPIRLVQQLGGRSIQADAALLASSERFEFPPRRPDQALLGCRRGPMKNKSNDLAAIILRGSQDASEVNQTLGLKLLENKELLVPGRGLEPPRCYPLVPETSASTNSATRAGRLECPSRARAIYAGGRELSIESA